MKREENFLPINNDATNLKKLLGSKTQKIKCCFTTELFYLHKRKLSLVNIYHSNISKGILLLNLIIINQIIFNTI